MPPQRIDRLACVAAVLALCVTSSHGGAADDPLPSWNDGPGRHQIVFDFTYDGPGFGKGGTGALEVDGKQIATRKIPHTIPFILTIDETFDVGIDTRTPVDDNDYQVPFAFTGELTKLTVALDRPKLTVADE